MATEHKPVQIDYRGPPGAAPRDGRMPIWERLIVSAIFGFLIAAFVTVVFRDRRKA
jgi:hypothetical protein